MIGEGSDCYNGINKEEDRKVKLQMAIDNWWEGLTQEEQLEIYKDNNPKEFMSPDELHDGGVSAVDNADSEYEYRRGI